MRVVPFAVVAAAPTVSHSTHDLLATFHTHNLTPYRPGMFATETPSLVVAVALFTVTVTDSLPRRIE